MSTGGGDDAAEQRRGDIVSVALQVCREVEHLALRDRVPEHRRAIALGACRNHTADPDSAAVTEPTSHRDVPASPQ